MSRIAWMACIAALVVCGGREGDAAQDRLPAGAKVLGRILVLEGERCLEGEVEAADDRYCLRQGASEIWVPAKSVLRVCPDWRAAYEYVKSRADLGDPEERLRLARWCQSHQQLDFALIEAKAAQEMRPTHAVTRSLVGVLQKTIAATKDLRPPAAKSSEPIDSVPTLDLHAEATAVFATRIQPILLNTCLSCHGSHVSGKTKFQLYRSVEGGQRGAMQRNLKAVLSYVNYERPELSPILDKAVSDHGLVKTAPLPGKKSAPYQTLEQWVRAVVATHPHLRERFAPPASATAPDLVAPPLAPFVAAPSAPRGDDNIFASRTPFKPVKPVLSPVVPIKEPALPVMDPKKGKTVTSLLDPRLEPKTMSDRPGVAPMARKDSAPPHDPPRVTPPAVAPAGHDPFDPAVFNRIAHPGR